jgi:hypothetical protein
VSTHTQSYQERDEKGTVEVVDVAESRHVVVERREKMKIGHCTSEGHQSPVTEVCIKS